MPTVQIIIKGKVQGVFYRASAKAVADTIGITGWIKNTAEGNVEALAKADEAQLHKFIAWCRKGPEEAIVKEVTVIPKEERAFKDFKILKE